jgi:hypothetical protein
MSVSADACYAAMKARDARFDGIFFTAVTSTGIYCRPVCSVKPPKRENCRFFGLAAQAESAQGITVRPGYRPPYDVAAMLAFMGTRRIKAIESIAAGLDKYEARRTFGINAVLHEDFPAGDGLRVPGALDGFELAVRAVLGQLGIVRQRQAGSHRRTDQSRGWRFAIAWRC